MPLMPNAAVVSPVIAVAQLYDNTAAGNIASWDVSGISQAYNHLKLVMYLRESGAVASDIATARFNNDSGANYDIEVTNGSTPSGISSGEAMAGTSGRIAACVGASASANLFAVSEALIPCYTQTTGEKIALIQAYEKIGTTASSNNLLLHQYGMSWRSTAAINRITIIPGTGSFVAGSRLTIYGWL